MPVFSIIIPTYNRFEMLKRAVSSVLNQTFKDFELIIVDDGSKKYREQIPLIEGLDKRIKLIRKNCNEGAAVARNNGIDIAQGKYISFLDDDDEYMPNFLEEINKLLESHKNEVDFCWSSVRFIDYSDDGFIKNVKRTRLFNSSLEDNKVLVEDLLSIGIGFGFTILSECIKSVGGFEASLRTVEDTDLFIRLIESGYKAKISSNPNVVLHNHHQKRLTGFSMHKKRINECKQLLEKYKTFFEQYPSLSNKINEKIKILNAELK